MSLVASGSVESVNLPDLFLYACFLRLWDMLSGTVKEDEMVLKASSVVELLR